MRFYSDANDLIDEHLGEIVEEPWNVFAADLLYFLACEYETGWIPYKPWREFEDSLSTKPGIHTPHRLSPFTNYMRRSVKYGVVPSDEEFELTYQLITPPDAEDKLARFIDHVIDAFDDFFAVDRSLKDMFLMLLYVGKMATVFYLHGTADAPQFALMFMADGLLKMSTEIPLNKAFRSMHAFAKSICIVHEKDNKRKA